MVFSHHTPKQSGTSDGPARSSRCGPLLRTRHPGYSGPGGQQRASLLGWAADISSLIRSPAASLVAAAGWSVVGADWWATAPPPSPQRTRRPSSDAPAALMDRRSGPGVPQRSLSIRPVRRIEPRDVPGVCGLAMCYIAVTRDSFYICIS